MEAVWERLHVCSPLSGVENSVGEKRLVVNLRHVKRFLWKKKLVRGFKGCHGADRQG